MTDEVELNYLGRILSRLGLIGIVGRLYRPFQKLDEFLNANFRILALIGVFAATSVYINTVRDDLSAGIQASVELAIIAGFMLVLLLSILIFVNLFIEMGGIKGYHLYDDVGLVLFAFFFYFMIASVITLPPQFEQGWLVFVLVTLVCGGMYGAMVLQKGVYSVEKILDESANFSDFQTKYLSTTVSLALFLFIIYIMLRETGVVSIFPSTLLQFISLLVFFSVVVVAFMSLLSFIILTMGMIIAQLRNYIIKFQKLL